MSRKTRTGADILAAKDKKMKDQENIDRDPEIQEIMKQWRAASPSNRWKEDTETIDEYAERYHRKQAQIAAQVADKSAQVADKSAQVADKSAQVADKSAYKKASPSHKGGKRSKKNKRTTNRKSRK
jgi:X-X-X-Leu-X-X-Gly heptad repeat protein